MADNPYYNQTGDQDQPAVVTGSFEVNPQENSAADLIRQKVEAIYQDAPDTQKEEAEATQASPRSKHQQFMFELSRSGKDLAAIQVEWNSYYNNLPDNEKYEVWQEFYDSQSSIAPGSSTTLKEKIKQPKTVARIKHQAARPNRAAKKLKDDRKPAEIQNKIKEKVRAGGKLSAKQHLQSLMFGLSMGALVVFIFLFGFFNEVIIAPFIQPSRASADTPIIINSSGIAPTSTPEVIIPKINVEIPVNYSETSTDENVIENDLQDGVVHYPTTVMPGQLGNAAFFGHSSNNIFNQGRYKFAFVLLHTLVPGDTFYLTNNDKVYVYTVIKRSIVAPTDVSVLGPVAGQSATATLITCDPPGTSINRLVVVGKQISPDPSKDTAAPASPTINPGNSSPSQLPGNGPSLWSKFIGTLSGKLVTLAVIAMLFLYGIRKIDNRKLAFKR
ncbi:MAG TPA: class E sortase [Candidatus Saccharimonadales bacterium]|nr:class E sortase [Candidatus Saccharimonadales bacterium]